MTLLRLRRREEEGADLSAPSALIPFGIVL